jgi:hypothetical protein
VSDSVPHTTVEEQKTDASEPVAAGVLSLLSPSLLEPVAALPNVASKSTLLNNQLFKDKRMERYIASV